MPRICVAKYLYSPRQVRARALLEGVRGLEGRRAAGWRLEELDRLLQPQRDNRWPLHSLVVVLMVVPRYLDLEQWVRVGEEWREAVGEETVEGVGGRTPCRGHVKELEVKVEELEHMVARAGEERGEVGRALVAAEEQVERMHGEMEDKEVVVRRLKGELEQLQGKVEQLEAIAERREVEVEQVGRRLEVVQEELVVAVARRKEMEGRMDARGLEREEREEREEEWMDLHTELQGQRRVVEVERRLREEVQVHLEEARVEVRRLAEELVGRCDGGGGEERGEEDSSLLHSTWASMVHDTSVDDRLLEGGAPVPHLLLRSPPRSSSLSPDRLSLIEELVEVSRLEPARLPSPSTAAALAARARLTSTLRALAAATVHQDRVQELVAGVEDAVTAFVEELGEEGEQEEEKEEMEKKFSEILVETQGGTAEETDTDQEVMSDVKKEETSGEVQKGGGEGVRRLCWVLVAVVVLLLAATFTGVQVEEMVYYPASWHALR